jgi:hypothetical protein
MRLRFIDGDLSKQRRELKPVVGDTVLYENQKYLVKEVGLRYIRAHKVGGSKGLHVMKIQDVVKVFTEVPGSVSPNLNYTP